MTESAIVVHHNSQPFDDDIRQRAFLLWMWECDASIPATAKKLREQETWDSAVANRPPRKTPDEDTLNRWKRQDDWPAKRHRVLVQDNTAGALYNQILGGYLLLAERAQRKILEFLEAPLTEPVLDKDGTYVGEKPTSMHTSILNAAKEVNTVLRLSGRAANEQDGGPKLTPIREKREAGDRTPEQIQKERMDRMKQLKKPRRGSRG